MVAFSLLSLLLATTTFASPVKRDFEGSCQVPASAFNDFPQGLSALTSPPTYVTMGFGNQNYTCNSNGTYTSLGAVGQMFDVSCLFGTSEFATIQEDAYNIWTGCEASITDPLDPTLVSLFQDRYNISVVGQHYFVNGDNQALTPVFDFTSSGSTNGNPGAIFFGEKIEDVPSPDGGSVDWLELQEISGQLANNIFRVNTVQGQPPGSCNPGSGDISVKYATKYILTN